MEDPDKKQVELEDSKSVLTNVACMNVDNESNNIFDMETADDDPLGPSRHPDTKA